MAQRANGDSKEKEAPQRLGGLWLGKPVAKPPGFELLNHRLNFGAPQLGRVRDPRLVLGGSAGAAPLGGLSASGGRLHGAWKMSLAAGQSNPGLTRLTRVVGDNRVVKHL